MSSNLPSIPHSVVANTRAVVLSSKKGVLLTQFCRDYKNLTGSFFPWKALGFTSAADMLSSMSDVVRFQYLHQSGGYRLFGIADDKMFLPSWVVKAHGPPPSKRGSSAPPNSPPKREGPVNVSPPRLKETTIKGTELKGKGLVSSPPSKKRLPLLKNVALSARNLTHKKESHKSSGSSLVYNVKGLVTVYFKWNGCPHGNMREELSELVSKIAKPAEIVLHNSAAFVRFSQLSDAQVVIGCFNGLQVCGVTLKVEPAREKMPQGVDKSNVHHSPHGKAILKTFSERQGDMPPVHQPRIPHDTRSLDRLGDVEWDRISLVHDKHEQVGRSHDIRGMSCDIEWDCVSTAHSINERSHDKRRWDHVSPVHNGTIDMRAISHDVGLDPVCHQGKRSHDRRAMSHDVGLDSVCHQGKRSHDQNGTSQDSGYSGKYLHRYKTLVCDLGLDDTTSEEDEFDEWDDSLLLSPTHHSSFPLSAPVPTVPSTLLLPSHLSQPTPHSSFLTNVTSTITPSTLSCSSLLSDTLDTPPPLYSDTPPPLSESRPSSSNLPLPFASDSFHLHGKSVLPSLCNSPYPLQDNLEAMPTLASLHISSASDSKISSPSSSPSPSPSCHTLQSLPAMAPGGVDTIGSEERLNLAQGKIIPVTVSKVVSPDEMWVQLTSDPERDLHWISEEIVRCAPSKLKKVELGSLCCFNSNLYNPLSPRGQDLPPKMRRALVYDNRERYVSVPQVGVFLLDVGIQMFCAVRDLFMLPESLYLHTCPPIMVNCALHGIASTYSASGFWFPFDIQLLWKHLNNKKVYMLKLPSSRQPNSHLRQHVELYFDPDGKESVVDLLVKEGYNIKYQDEADEVGTELESLGNESDDPRMDSSSELPELVEEDVLPCANSKRSLMSMVTTALSLLDQP